MKIVRNIARLLIAPVFIFAGFVKAIDPLGLTYKFSDYFEAFHLDFLGPFALFFAILLSTAELLIGINLLLKLRMRETAWALLIFMVFFTLLTLGIAIANPVTDCGCFGDALILTNWQTFFKNLFFLVPTLLVFVERGKYVQFFTSWIQYLASGSIYFVLVMLSVYSLRTLPLIDFRPYKIGSDIPAGMEVPEGMPVDRYETILVYEKGGEQHEFTLQSEEQPWNDSSWVWVETKNLLVEKGYTPPIHDFSISSLDGEDVTDTFLNDDAYSFLVVMHDIEKADRSYIAEINNLMKQASDYGYAVYGLTASGDEAIYSAQNTLNLSFGLFITDDITLKTIIRSNPGLVLVKQGVVLDKWAGSRLPGAKLFEDGGLAYSISELHARQRKTISLLIISIIAFAAILTSSLRLLITKQEN